MLKPSLSSSRLTLGRLDGTLDFFCLVFCFFYVNCDHQVLVGWLQTLRPYQLVLNLQSIRAPLEHVYLVIKTLS